MNWRCRPARGVRGITKAARRLHRVQSNVTTRVKQLEERLGAQLFLRQHRRLVLSPQGKRLLAYADRLLPLSSEAEAALRNGTPAGALQIGRNRAQCDSHPTAKANRRPRPQTKNSLIVRAHYLSCDAGPVTSSRS